MTLEPGYGETPLDPDEEDALTPGVRAVLGNAPLKAAIFDIEQQIERAVAEELIGAVLDRTLGLDEMLTPAFVFDLHARALRCRLGVGRKAARKAAQHRRRPWPSSG